MSLTGHTEGVKKLFQSLDKDGNGTIDSKELRAFAKRFFDGREPTDKELARIMARMDRDGDNKLTEEEVMMAVESLAATTQPDSKKDHNRATAKAEQELRSKKFSWLPW